MGEYNRKMILEDLRPDEIHKEEVCFICGERTDEEGHCENGCDIED